jgi:hypothetical protein
VGDGGFHTTVVVGIFRCFFPWLKRQEPDADPLSLSGIEVRNARGESPPSPNTL